MTTVIHFVQSLPLPLDLFLVGLVVMFGSALASDSMLLRKNPATRKSLWFKLVRTTFALLTMAGGLMFVAGFLWGAFANMAKLLT